jgi:hypothetical protein
MSFVVTAFSWAGWIWTVLFFTGVVPLMAYQARRVASRRGFEALGSNG